MVLLYKFELAKMAPNSVNIHLNVQYIVLFRDIHAYVYHKYSDTQNTFNMLCPLNKAKVIFKGSSENQFYFKWDPFIPSKIFISFVELIVLYYLRYM